MARKFTISRYNNFLRSAKSQQGLNHKQAQQLYREIKKAVGYSPSRYDLKKHPRIARREAKKLVKQERAERKFREISILDDYDQAMAEAELTGEQIVEDEFGGNVEY